MATPVFTIYTYGLGPQVVQTLNAVAAIFGNNEFMAILIKLCMVIGATIIMYRTISGAIDESPKWVLYLTTITTLVFQPTASVMVRDPITQYERVVGNVPILISIVGGVICTVSKAITTGFDTAFSQVNSFSFHENGYVFGSRLASEMRRIKVIDPGVRENLHRFVKNCIIMPAMTSVKWNKSDLYAQNDIWEFIKTNASGIRMTFYKDKTTSDMITCRQATIKFDGVWKDEINRSLAFNSFFLSNKAEDKKKFADDNNPEYSSANVAIAQEIKNNIKTTFGRMGDIAADADKLIRQQMMINAIKTVPKEEAGGIDFAIAKSMVQQQTTSMISGEMAARYLPIIMSTLQIICFALLPFVVMFALLPGGIKTLIVYIEIMLWLQTWPPLFAVLNMIVEVASGITSESILSTGFNMGSASKLSSINSIITSVASGLFLLIPYIAYSITKGGVASFSHIAGSLTSPSQSIAGQAGAELASGNVSMGNISYGNASAFNTSAFKYDTVSNYRGGAQEFMLSDGGYQVTQPDGSNIFKGGAGLTSSTGMTNMRFSGAISSMINEQLTMEESNLDSLSKQYDRAQSNELRAGSEFIESTSKAFGNDERWTQDNGSTYSKAISDTARLTNAIKDQLGVSHQVAAGFSLGISQGIPLGKISQHLSNTGLDAKGNIGYDGNIRTEYARALDIAKEQGYEVRYDNIVRAAHDKSLSQTSGWDARSAENFSKAHDERESISNQQSATYQKVNSLRKAKEMSENESMSFDREYNQEYLEFVQSKTGGDSLKAYKAMNQDSPQSHFMQGDFIHSKFNDLVDRSYHAPNFRQNFDDTNVGNLKDSPNNLHVNENMVDNKRDASGLSSIDQNNHNLQGQVLKMKVATDLNNAVVNINPEATKVDKTSDRLKKEHDIAEWGWEKRHEEENKND